MHDTKTYLTAKGLVNNEQKEQLFGPQAAATNAWQQRFPEYAGAYTTHASDLGVTQRTGKTHGVLRDQRIQHAGLVAGRIDRLPLRRAQKQRISRAVLLAGALYGCEVEPLIAEQIRKLRLHLAKAIWQDRGAHNRTAMLLLEHEGELDPFVAMSKRLVVHWMYQVRTWDGWSPDIRAYLDTLTAGSSYHRGPLQEACALAYRLGWEIREPRWWAKDGVPVDILLDPQFLPQVVADARNVVWRQLARQRTHFEGLETGLDYAITLKWKRTLKADSKSAHQVHSIMTDAIWTPARAARRKMRTDAKCIHCGGEDATVMHLWWHCPRLHQGYDPVHQRLLRHMRELGGKPVCLWTLGLVPEGFVPRRPSVAMTSPEYRDCPFDWGAKYIRMALPPSPLWAYERLGEFSMAGNTLPIAARLYEARTRPPKGRNYEP